MCFPDLSIDESGVLKSPIIMSFSKVSFMNVVVLVFVEYMFRSESVEDPGAHGQKGKFSD